MYIPQRYRRWALFVLPAFGLYGAVFLANSPLMSWAFGSADPDALLAQAVQRCDDIQDYRCRFTKQERMNGKLGKRQAMDVLFREPPFSVYMRWVENADRIRRALYVKGRNRDASGQDQVVVEPSGALARWVAGEVTVPVRGKEARKAGRRTMDQFGFRQALKHVIRENEEFTRTGVLHWERVRESSVDGRPTYVLVRHLPYTDAKGPYPNARLEIELDQEWLLPVALRAYADHEGNALLEEYTFTKIALNPGLSDADFSF